jgi:hypothetical protein
MNQKHEIFIKVNSLALALSGRLRLCRRQALPFFYAVGFTQGLVDSAITSLRYRFVLRNGEASYVMTIGHFFTWSALRVIYVDSYRNIIGGSYPRKAAYKSSFLGKLKPVQLFSDLVERHGVFNKLPDEHK